MRRNVNVNIFFLLLFFSAPLFAQYTNVTLPALGSAPGSVEGKYSICWVDINYDGFPDLYTSPYYFYINNGDGTFTQRDPSDIQAVINAGGLFRSTFADCDNDGDLDFVTTGYYHRVTYYLENSGAPDYRFTGDTLYAHPVNVDGGHPTFLDGDSDGSYEVYLGMLGNWDPYAIGADQYFKLDPSGNWQNVTATYIPQLGTNFYKRPTRGTVAADYDNDGDVDIFVPVYGISWSENWEDILWQNDGSGNFVDVAWDAGVAIEPHCRYGIGLGSGASWGDYDNDGDFDLIVANIHGWAALFRNEGGYFNNITEQAGLITTGPEKQWHNTSWIDYDNDGDLDLFLTQWYDGFQSYVFRNDGPENLGHFTDVTAELGFNGLQEFCYVDGVGAGDYDRDGDMDIAFYANQPGYAGTYLYRNDQTSGNHWLVLDLKGNGTTTGATAHGSKVKIFYKDGTVSTLKQVESSSGDEIMHMLQVHFGLGNYNDFQQIQVNWLDGTIEYWTPDDIGGIDRWASLQQGNGSAESNVLFVDTENSGFEDGTEAHPFNTITEAVTSAANGDIVIVSKGTYHENISFNGKNIMLFGKHGPTYCIIDGTNTPVSFTGSEDSTAQLSGFTVTNGSNSGILCNGASPKITNCIITNNSAVDGGGVRLINSSPLFENVVISWNAASNTGGGIVLTNSHPQLKNVTVFGNSSANGGAISALGVSHPNLLNTILWNDFPNEVTLEGQNGNQITIAYSCVKGGRDSVVTGTGAAVNWLTGNINQDPLFIDPENGNFRLDEGSPCRGTGLNGVDMGAHITVYSGVYHGPVWHVAVNGSDTEGDGSSNNPFATIQNCISFARSGDTVMVHQGTYTQRIDYLGKNILIASEYILEGNTDFIASTILDGGSGGTVVSIDNGEDSTATLCGLTIINGTAAKGGGISITNGARPTLSHVRVIGNSATSKGGGIFCNNSQPVFDNVTVYGNHSQLTGGGVYFENQASGDFNECLIQNNSAVGNGGGVCFDGESEQNIQYTAIVDNTAQKGGGIYVYGTNAVMNNVTVAKNTADEGSGVYCMLNGNLNILNSIFWNDPADEIRTSDFTIPSTITIDYSDVQNGQASFVLSSSYTLEWGTSNITGDPLFCPPDTNYTIASNSPCNQTGFNGENIGALPVGCTEVSVDDETSGIPKTFALRQSFPNPFNSRTVIKYDLPTESSIRLRIYNALGESIATLVEGEKNAGSYQVEWNARQAASGIYFYTLEATPGNGGQPFIKTFKMILLK